MVRSGYFKCKDTTRMHGVSAPVSRSGTPTNAKGNRTLYNQTNSDELPINGRVHGDDFDINVRPHKIR